MSVEQVIRKEASRKLRAIVKNLIVLLLSASVLRATEPWEGKPYTEWTQEDIKRVLLHSPWVRQIGAVGNFKSSSTRDLSSTRSSRDPDTGQMIDPVTRQPVGIRKEDETEAGRTAESITITWTSALTCRQAGARQLQLASKLSTKAAEDALAQAPASYIISVSGSLSSEVFGMAEEALRESASLETEKAKRKVAAASARVTWIGQRFFIDFSFPREMEGKSTIEPSETRVRFRCKLRTDAVKADFDLQKMTHEGHLDL